MAVEVTNSPSDPTKEELDIVGASVPDESGASSTIRAGEADAQNEMRFRIPQPLQLAMILVFGLAVGGYVIHKHDTAKVPVVIVNGYVIDRTSFEQEMEELGGAGTLRQMVSEELQLQYAQKLGVLPTQKEVQDRYNELLNNPTAAAAISGQAEGAVKRELMIQMAKARVATIGVDVTDADIKKFYQENIDPSNPHAQFYQPETVTLSVIETKNQDAIQKASDALMISREPFDAVARQYSEDPTKLQGGQLPPVLRGRTNLSLIPGMEKAVFDLSVGQIYGPAKFANSWWIIQCDDKEPAVAEPFNSVKDECRDGAALLKGLPVRAAQVQTDFETFQKNSKIRSMLPQYQNAVQFGK
jgi:parvulin-like peptidyl-prolyl isomerase